MPSDRSEPRVTHHKRILTELLERITSRDWPPGFALPLETTLAASYGVSRMTMNKVLSQLTREGYLLRRKRLGTFVARPVTQTTVMEIPDIETEVGALGQVWRMDLRAQGLRRPSAEEIAGARIDPAQSRKSVLALQGVHLADELPFCLETRIINPEVAVGAAAQDFRKIAPGRWLLQQIPWTSAEQSIRAVSASEEQARDLGLKKGDACLQITRRTETACQWVTLVCLTYPGARHKLVARFGPTPRRDEGEEPRSAEGQA